MELRNKVYIFFFNFNRALIGRTHTQQAGMSSYLKADWLLHVYAMWYAILTFNSLQDN